MWRALAVGLLAAAAACSRREPPSVGAAPEGGGDRDGAGDRDGDGDRDGALEGGADAGAERVLDGVPALLELAGKAGVVAVPLGALRPRPIMIALHGGSDRPEWACNAWRGITGGYPVLVCPHGVGTNESSLAWSSPADTKLRVARAIAAAREALGQWVLETSTVVLVGFSMGATQAALLARGEPRRYRRLVLAESAYAPEPAMAFARPWAAGGGERAVFLCTTLGCEATYRTAARNVARQGAPARLDLAGTNAHGMWDAVVQSMRRDWPWLVEGAEGWEAYAPPPEEGLPGKTETFDAP